jgi:trk system potassium uptake protein TrkH
MARFWSHNKPHWLVTLGFLAVIVAGACLLSLPAANTDGQRPPLLTAFFTATSASCVTGLSVVDIGADLTLFGQWVVLVMIQIGGLGIMTLGTFLLVVVGRRVSAQSEFVLMDAYGVAKSHSLRSLLLCALLFTVFFEGLGTFLLWLRYRNLTLPDGGSALYYAFFHAVNAFCNAGFSLHHDSLVSFRDDPFYLLVASTLIICGGLGFLVLYNLVTFRFWRRNLKTRGRLTLHTRIVLSATLILLLLGSAFFLLQEWSAALSGLSVRDKLVCGFFHGVVPRTAGFNAVPMDALSESSRFTTVLLMMIGGSPGSAAGGMKTTTLSVLIMTMIAMYKNRTETVMFSRTVPFTVVRESLVIFLLTVVCILVVYGLLLMAESPRHSDDASKLFFETVSAVGTVGLSINHTASLSAPGRCVVIAAMFLGRIGPLTVTLMIGSRNKAPCLHYPEEEVVVG